MGVGLVVNVLPACWVSEGSGASDPREDPTQSPEP